MRKAVQRGNAYNIDAKAGHSFGPNPVSLRQTAIKKANRELDRQMYGTPKQGKATMRRKREQETRGGHTWAGIDETLGHIR